MNARNFVISLVIFLAFSPCAWSQTTHRWTGNTNNNWDNAGNWGDASGFPDGVNDNVLFNNTGIRRNIDLRGGNRDVHNATFNLSGGTDYTFDSNTSGSGTFRLNGDLSITAAGESITFHSATSGGNGIDLVQAAAGNWTNNGGLLIVHSNLTGSAGITMNGNVTFNRPNSYTGNFTIQSGTTTLNAGTAFANAVVTLNINNGINFNGLSGASFGALQGSGNISLGGTQLTVGSSGSDRTFSGGLNGDAFLGASFTYSGSSQLTLSGSMNGPKSVTVTNGNLRFQNGSFSVGGPAQLVLNGGNASITQGATLKLSAVGPDTGSEAFLNSNTLVVDGGRFLTARITSNTDGVVNLAADPAGNSALEIGAINGESTPSSTFAGTLSGTATARKIGTGTWTLTHANPFSGTMQIDEGSVVLGVGSALQNATVEINLDNGLNINGLNATIGALSGSGDLNLGGKILTIDGNGQSTTYSGDLSGNDASKLTYSGTDIQTLMGTTGSVGVLSSTGGGELKLSGVDLTATADIEPAGVAISGSKLTISDGSLLHFTSGELTTALNGLTTIAGNGTTLTVDNPVFSIVGGQTIVEDNAELIAIRNNIAANSSPGSGSMIARSGASVTINGDTTIGQNVGDTGDLLVTGAGTTYQTDSMDLGGSSFSSGGTGTVNVESGGSLIVTGTTNCYTSASTLTINGGSFSTDQLDEDTGVLGVIALSDPAGGAALTVGTADGSSTFNGVIADAAGGPGSLDKVGTGSFELTSANTFSGTAAINGGSIIVGHADALRNATTEINVNNGLDINGPSSVNLGSLSGSGDLNLGGATLVVGDNDASTSYSGILAGTPGSSVQKVGTGTWTLTGTCIGMDHFNVDEGAIIVDGGSIDTDGHVLQIIRAPYTVRNGGSYNHANTTDVRGAPLVIESGASFVTGAALRTEDAGWQVSVEDADLTVSGNLRLSYFSASDSGSFTVTGAGSNMDVGGRLDLGANGLTNTSTTLVESGATVTIDGETVFYGNGHSFTIDQATFSTGQLNNALGAVAPLAISDPTSGSALTVGANDGSSTFDGIISDASGGSGSLDKVGTGSFELTNANTFTGGVTISGGTLLAGNTNGSATGTGGVAVANGGTLGGNGSASGTTTVESGGIVAPGASAGLLTLGSVTFNAGSTLAIELGGTTPDTEHDQLDVTNTATLAGTLNLTYLAPFTASTDQSFVILTAGTLAGTFNTVNYPDSQSWFIAYDSNAGTVTVGICADSDSDGVCDSADLCPGFDDNSDADEDTVPDACDTCPGVPNVHNETQDAYYPTIAAAIAAALDGDVIELGACTFVERGLLLDNKDITIRGQGPDSTLIDGDGVAGSIMRIQNGSQCTIEDVALINGFANAGSGGGAVVISSNSNVTLNNCRFEGNDSNGHQYGAVFSQDSTAKYNECTFRNNTTVSFGNATAVGTWAGSASFRNCLFDGEQNGVSVLFYHTTNEVSVGSIVNCTFAGFEGDDYVLADGFGTHVDLVGSVFDGGAAVVEAWDLASATVSRCLFPGATDDNIDGIPTFVDALSGDYRLAAGSLGIDAADYEAYVTAGGGATDLNGDPRTNDDMGTIDTGVGALTYLDMGAYEFQGLTDSDGDGVGDAVDACPGFDDHVDSDGDGMADGCDPCPNSVLGDVSGDGVVSVNDSTSFAAVMLDPTTATPDERCASDTNLDGNVNGLDVQGMIELLLGN